MPSVGYGLPKNLTHTDKLYAAFVQSRHAPLPPDYAAKLAAAKAGKLEPLPRHPQTKAPPETDRKETKDEKRERKRLKEAIRTNRSRSSAAELRAASLKKTKDKANVTMSGYLFGIPTGQGLPQTPKVAIDIDVPALPTHTQRERGELDNHIRHVTEAVLPWMQGPKHYAQK